MSTKIPDLNEKLMAGTLPEDPFDGATPGNARAKVADLADARRKRAPNWSGGLVLTKEGQPKRGLANTLLVLGSHPLWVDVIAYNLFTESIVKLKPPPVRLNDGASSAGEWNDVDSARTAAWVASEVGFEPAVAHVDQAVAAVAESNTVHPVREYLNGLVWDGTPRIDGFLVRYFGVSDAPYAQAVGARWLISAVARAFVPGCQADCVLVLEGKQGIGKSTGLEAVFGPQWFSDTTIPIGEKDSYQALRGNWCHEFGELDSFRGRAVTAIKNFVSARSDNYRPSYARRNRDFPRQIVFAATTNEHEYFLDRSGNRRFWPVACGEVVHVEQLRTDRDQIWAEAKARYDAGEAWHVNTPELQELCESAQRERETDDPWTALIAAWLQDPKETTRFGEAPSWLIAEDGISTHQVATHALKLSPAELARHDLMTRIGQTMRRLDWQPRQLRRDGTRIRLYFPPQPSQLSLPSQAAKGEQP